MNPISVFPSEPTNAALDGAIEPTPESLPLPDEEHAIKQIAGHVEERLAALNDGSGRARRRLIALLQGTEKKNASKRLALRARKFAQQGGKCAKCGQMFDRTRRLSSRIEENTPLVCYPCDRADILSSARG